MNRITRHVNQEMTEYWSHSYRSGWQVIEDGSHNEWKEWEYIELRHNMDPANNGLYGPVISVFRR